MTPRVASAPVSYGVFEMTVGRPGLPDGPALADAIAGAGYAGTELGPPGYFGRRGEEVAELLGERDLALAGAFLALRFSRREAFAEDLDALDALLGLLDDAADGDRPPVLLCDGLDEPERVARAGRIEAHREAWLPQARAELLAANAQRAAERCHERGFPVAFHPHAGSYVETPREIAGLVERVDPEILPLCFDSGHVAFGGGDPLAILREYGELVRHVHLKDVDRARLRAVLEAGGDMATAWEAGVFCELGTGDAQVDACLDQLRARAYDGWIVVEQDRVLGRSGSFEAAVESAQRNREHLRERGL